MFMDYCPETSTMFLIENLDEGFRIVILTFKEFSVSIYTTILLYYQSANQSAQHCLQQ